jgi:ABC-type hemin transport system substrate-binding protein
MRIVSLVPSLTELLARWGLEERLVGRTRYCVEPRRLSKNVPAMGGTKDPDLNQILALAPDLVLLEKDENTLETGRALMAGGIRTHVLAIRTVKDAVEALVELGGILGVPDQAKAEAESLLSLLKKRRRKGLRTITFVWREPWILAGPDTYVSDVARQAGFEPMGAEGYPRVALEDLEAMTPEVILLPTEPFRFTARHRTELQKRFPEASVQLVEGRNLTWFLSRTQEGLLQLRDLRQRLA